MPQDPDFIPADQDFIPAEPSAPANAPPIGSIGPQETGVGHYLQGVKSDIETGGGTTMPGRLLRWLGAPGINSGTSPETAAQIAGPLVGPVNAAIGVSQMGQHPIMGALKAGAGVLQAASPALAFTAPEAAGELPNIAKGASQMSKAGKILGEIESRAGEIPIDTTAPGNVALDIQNLAKSGGQMPKVVRDFLKRATDPEQGPMTYAEARKFFSNASRLSADEFDRLTPVMQRQSALFAKTLNESITGAAAKVGQADNYLSALKQYASGAMQSKRYQMAGKYLLDLLKASGLGAAGYAGYRVATGK